MKVISSYLSALLLIIPMWSFANNTPLSKTINESFPLSAGDWVDLSNKWGEVHVLTRDGGSQVDIKIDIQVDAKSDEDAEKFMEYLKIKTEKKGDRVLIQVDFDGDITSMNMSDGEKQMKLKKGGKIKVEDFSIDVEVTMPKQNNLSLHHWFSDCYVGDLSGTFNANLEYSNLKGSKLDGKSSMKMNFSEASLEYTKDLMVQLDYGELNLDKGDKVQLKASFSEFEIGEVNTLVTENGYNTYDLGKVGDAHMEEEFSSVDIDELSTKLNLSLSYGSLDIDDVLNGFSEIDIRVDFGEVELELPDGQQYALDLNSSWGEIDLDLDGLTFDTKDLSDFGQAIKAHKGSGNQGDIEVTVNYGGLRLKD
jgi:hypothetical protein